MMMRFGLLFLASTRAFSPIQRGIPRASSHRLYSSVEKLPEGIVKSVAQSGSGKFVKEGEIATLRYTCSVPGSPPFVRGEEESMKVGAGDMIEGWEKVLPTMEVGERALIRITDPEYGYGSEGFPPFIPPNAEIEMDVEVLSSMTFNDFASASLRPNMRSAMDSLVESLDVGKSKEKEENGEGVEGLIKSAKSWVEFGFGSANESTEKPPWFLSPNITFPLAAIVVFATFYYCLSAGGIVERGAEVTDELDELVLSMNPVIIAALAMNSLGL